MVAATTACRKFAMAAARVSAILQEEPLLADLANEYQELKASGAHVDYRAWIKGKLATPSKVHSAATCEANSHSSSNVGMPLSYPNACPDVDASKRFCNGTVASCKSARVCQPTLTLCRPTTRGRHVPALHL